MSCENNKTKDNDQITTFSIKEPIILSTVRLSDLGFVDVKYIPLETNEQCIISDIELIALNWGDFRIISTDDDFLIKIWNSIFFFRIDGSFVSKIEAQGRGPKEYTVVHDIEIDKKDSMVYIADGWQNKINVYLKDGQFVRTIKIPLHGPLNFRLIGDDIICYNDNMYGNVENSYLLLHKSGEIIKAFPNRYPFIKSEGPAFGLIHENLFYRFKNKILKKEIYSDTIYSFEGKDFTPYMVINEGEKLLSPRVRSEYDGKYIGENYINQLNLFEFGDFIYYGIIYKYILFGKVDIYGFLGSEKRNFQLLFDLGQGIINDLDGGPNIVPFTNMNDSTVVTLIDALTLKKHIESVEFINSRPIYPEKKKELEKLAASLKETDNPILVLVRLKE